MFEAEDTVNDIHKSESCKDFVSLLDHLNSLVFCNIHNVDAITSDLIDVEFLEEIRNVVQLGTPIYFGKTLRSLKCIVTDDCGLREHEIFFQYKGPKKLIITSVQLPHSLIQEREYGTIHDLVNSFKHHVNELASYFSELERIDRFCTVVEPVNPTFKEDYRKIMLDDRIWLHVEVTPQGLATNVHLVGQSEQWQDKFQAGLGTWDHDQDIVENIMTIFDLMEFPVPANKSASDCPVLEERPIQHVVCSICLCAEVDSLGVPQPLCQNLVCGTYFHSDCLFQWLVVCSGGRPPAYGVVTGSCPACFQPISCSERDN